MARILITGGSGFIGRNLVEGLETAHTILTPTHTELNLLDEVSVERYLINYTPTVIIHCAGLYPNGLLHNLQMFLNLSKYAKRCSVGKFISYGSGAEFNRNYWKPQMEEDYFDTHIPTDEYGLAKYLINKIIQDNESDCAFYNLRLFGVYGKYEDRKRRFLSVCYDNILKNRLIEIRGNIKFDYLFIDDLVKITEWFIYNIPRYDVYNVCSSKPYYLSDLASMTSDIMKLPCLINTRPNHLPYTEYSGNNSRLLEELETEELETFEFTPIEKGIENLVTYYGGIKNVER